MKSALLCEHANEMPMICPCEEDCYCKYYSCKNRKIDKVNEKLNKYSELLNIFQSYFLKLNFEQLEKLNNDESFKINLKELIQKYLKPKPEPINESKIIDDFWDLKTEQKYQILKDFLNWSETEARWKMEDYGWGISPTILRKLREKSLLRDFRNELDKYATK